MTKIRQLLKASVTTLTGGLILMFVAGIVINSLGTFLSGGADEWKEALRRAAPFMFFWRIALYVGIFMLWRATCRLYAVKEDHTGTTRMQRIGRFGLAIALFVEASRLIVAWQE